MNEPEKKEYAPLTEKQKKIAEWRYAWRYVLPGLILLAAFLLPYDTSLVAGICMIPYALVTYLLALKPSLVLVFALQDSRKEVMHVPVDAAEEKKYRQDGKGVAIFLFILTLVFFVLWFFRKG